MYYRHKWQVLDYAHIGFCFHCRYHKRQRDVMGAQRSRGSVHGWARWMMPWWCIWTSYSFKPRVPVSVCCFAFTKLGKSCHGLGASLLSSRSFLSHTFALLSLMGCLLLPRWSIDSCCMLQLVTMGGWTGLLES